MVAWDGDEAAVERLIDGLTGGRGLYLWQRRLLKDWLKGRRWDAIDVPTGLGKTTVMTLWLIARATGANLPRRLIYIVDRRAVVDQATEEATALANRLDKLLTEDLSGLGWRRHLGLTKTDGSLDTWLPISTLRGQHLDNRRWMENPAGAAIVVGTVDMIGSRMLFEGYGVSRRMRPVHAGLTGIDSLIILDEAHLVPPFEALVRQAAKLGQGNARGAPAPDLLFPLQLTSLSATGGERPGTRVFRLTEDDLGDPPVRARLTAPKHLRLMRGATTGDIAQRLSEQAWDFGAGGRRVIVFCNSRRTAQDVEAELRRIAKKDGSFGKDPKLTELLVGERRYRERLRLTGDGTAANGSPVFNRFRLGGELDSSGLPAFLIATSAGEVGVDLDADDMVCDLVAWERMVQRLGRVNRRPVPGEARVAVVPVADEKEAEDDIGADRLAALRAPFESVLWPLGEDGAKDASPLALRWLKETPALSDVLSAATTPEALRPPLTRAVLDAWSLTSLVEHPGRPKIEPWLRGWVETKPQTTVVWRRLFPLHEGEAGSGRPAGDLKAFFEDAAPPHVSESLAAPTWRVVEVLRKRAEALRKTMRKIVEPSEIEPRSVEGSSEVAEGDLAVEGAGGDLDAGIPVERTPAHEPVVVLLTSDGKVEHLYDIAGLVDANADGLVRLFSNATVVVDARLGGLDANGLLDAKASQSPDTIDMPEGGWGLDLDKTWGRRVSFGDRPKARTDRLWRLDEFQWAALDSDDSPGLWVELWRGGGLNPGDAAVSAKAQALGDHHRDTGSHARRIADDLALASPYRELLIAAAKAHDLGKDRKLWQDAMRAGSHGRPYAKTEGGGDGRALNGYRHEFGSLRDVLAVPGVRLPAFVSDEPGLHDLALHLILAHHGYGRPTINPYDPNDPPSRSIEGARDAALRFARLQATWGPWGLAWWEALLRAADWAASRELNEAVEVSLPEGPVTRPAEAAHG